MIVHLTLYLRKREHRRKPPQERNALVTAMLPHSELSKDEPKA